jgi:hypothetical protein
MPNVVETVGLEMPDDFPTGVYNAINQRVKPKREPYPALWFEYGTGWNAVAYRFRACVEHGEAFAESVSRYTAAPEQPHRHIQEREIVSFFVAGLSCIECTFYSLYGIASMMAPSTFPMATYQEREAVTPKSVTRKFNAHFSVDSICNTLGSVLGDAKYNTWVGLRNILAHRQTPGRAIEAMPDVAAWQNVVLKTGPADFEIKPKSITERRLWLSQTVHTLLAAIDDWTTRHASRLPAECR